MDKGSGDNRAHDQAEPVQKTRRHKGVDYKLIIGWGISVAAHLVILAIITQIGWAGSGGLRKSAVEVEIIEEEETDMLSAGHAGQLDTAEAMKMPELVFADQQTTQALAQIDVDLEDVELDTQIDLAVAATELSDSAANIQWAQMATDGSGGKGRGGASFFGLRAGGGKFVFVVDKSGSMGNGGLVTAKSELIRSIKAMNAEMKFYVIFYDDNALPMQEAELVAGTDKNKKRSFAWIEGIGANGGTEPAEAMKMALKLKPDAIWLLSDGEFSKNTADAINQHNPGRKVKIHTIAFMSDSGKAILQQIAKDNRGSYRFVTAAGKRVK